MGIGRLSGAIAVDGAAAFVGHSDGGEEGPAVAAAVFGRKGQSGLLEHFPDPGLLHILALFHETGGKFVNIAAQRIAVLADENHPVFVFPIHAVENDTVGLVFVGHSLQLPDFFGPGGNVIGRNAAVPVNGFEFIEVQKTGAGFLRNSADIAHR